MHISGYCTANFRCESKFLCTQWPKCMTSLSDCNLTLESLSLSFHHTVCLLITTWIYCSLLAQRPLAPPFILHDAFGIGLFVGSPVMERIGNEVHLVPWFEDCLSGVTGYWVHFLGISFNISCFNSFWFKLASRGRGIMWWAACSKSQGASIFFFQKNSNC